MVIIVSDLNFSQKTDPLFCKSEFCVYALVRQFCPLDPYQGSVLDLLGVLSALRPQAVFGNEPFR